MNNKSDLLEAFEEYTIMGTQRKQSSLYYVNTGLASAAGSID